MLRDSTAAVVRTCPRTIPLPMITMRKSIHGFLFPYIVMGLRFAALWAAGRLELRYYHMLWSLPSFSSLTKSHQFTLVAMHPSIP